MAAPDGAYIVRNALVTIDEVEYANQCTVARLVPETPIQTQRTLVPDGAVQDVDSPVWTFEISLLQVNKSGGLAKALRAAPVGSQMEVELRPRDVVGDDGATFTVLVIPPPFGGSQGQWATAEM